MTRFFFDILVDDQIVPDEDGMDLPDIRAAAREASDSIADLARHPVQSGFEPLSISVRTLDGPVFKVDAPWRSGLHIRSKQI